MFLRNLNVEQQKAFLAIAMKIVGADGRLDPGERRLIEAMRVEMGLLVEMKLPTGTIEELSVFFGTRNAQATAMLEGIALALSDNDFSGEEQKILRALALIWNISEEEATAMEEWVLEYQRLMKRAGELLAI